MRSAPVRSLASFSRIHATLAPETPASAFSSPPSSLLLLPVGKKSSKRALLTTTKEGKLASASNSSPRRWFAGGLASATLESKTKLFGWRDSPACLAKPSALRRKSVLRVSAASATPSASTLTCFPAPFPRFRSKSKPRARERAGFEAAHHTIQSTSRTAVFTNDSSSKSPGSTASFARLYDAMSAVPSKLTSRETHTAEIVPFPSSAPDSRLSRAYDSSSSTLLTTARTCLA
mmetsp:Transcript_87973/g.175972  ORF Transcript_87973/g.175972 Transcript_87973/m.175972 type:complete len:233 (-) Transcript_87973:377-1075(-)